MWGLFWRLYSAHLFADFTLQTPTILEQKGTLRGTLVHSLLVLAAATIVVIQPALFRPILFIMLAALFALHFATDWLKSMIGDVPARLGLVLFAADQLVHIGVILMLSALFGWGYYYGPVPPFVRLALAIFAIWTAPIVIYIIPVSYTHLTLPTKA